MLCTYAKEGHVSVGVPTNEGPLIELLELQPASEATNLKRVNYGNAHANRTPSDP